MNTNLPGAPACANEVVVHSRDYFEVNAFGADGFAFADVGAVAEGFFVHLRDHAEGASVAFGLALRE